MDRTKNPFAPGAGAPPPALVGREEILADGEVTLKRVLGGRPLKSLLLIGLRGVGKTVLLNRLQQLAEEQLGYIAILMEAPEDKRLPAFLIPPLRTILFQLDRYENVNEKVKRAFQVLKSFASSVKVKVGEQIEIGLDIEPERGSADSGDLGSDLTALLLAVADAAAARNKAVALFLDEMQYLTESELSALIMAIHRVVQKQAPLVLVGAGLPQLVGLAGKAKSYAERLFDFPEVGALKARDAKAALLEPVTRAGVSFQDSALNEIVRATQGYPYFLQEWGYHTWNLAVSSPITLDDVKNAHQRIIQKLDESFFRVRLDRLTSREKDYLRAMSELGPEAHRSGDIAEQLGMKVQSAAPLRSNLIRKGMIFSPTHGDTAFTVPLFDEFMKRTLPILKRRPRD